MNEEVHQSFFIISEPLGILKKFAGGPTMHWKSDSIKKNFASHYSE